MEEGVGPTSHLRINNERRFRQRKKGKMEKDKFFNVRKAAEEGRFEYGLLLLSQIEWNRLTQTERDEAGRLTADCLLAEILRVPEWHVQG